MHLSVTASHPFYHATRGWVHAGKLVVGDKLSEDGGGTLTVTSVLFNPNAPTNLTYNLSVADFHTYFVGEDGVLVHNGKADIKQANDAFKEACKIKGVSPTKKLKSLFHDQITGQGFGYKDMVDEALDVLSNYKKKR